MERLCQIVILLLLCYAVGCTRGRNPQLPVKKIISEEKSKAAPLQQLDTAGQLKQARIFLMKLKTAIVNNDQPRLLNMIHFPMQTQLMWMNESQTIDEKVGLLSKEEFPKYYRKSFFDKEQRRVLGYEQGDEVYPLIFKAIRRVIIISGCRREQIRERYYSIITCNGDGRMEEATIGSVWWLGK